MAFAVVELRMSESEFWDSTPAKYFALCEVRQTQIERDDFRLGYLIDTVRAVAGEKKRVHPLDFFPWKRPRKNQRERNGDSFVENMRRRKQAEAREKGGS